MGPVRRGGRAINIRGDLLTWSEAVGARGTRWREALEHDGRLLRALLLESTDAGRPARLEMTTQAGLLTLHPEPDESAMHGNVVGADGVRHLAFPWSAEHDLQVFGSTAALTATLRRLDRLIPAGEAHTLDLLQIDDDLTPRPARWSFERISQREWRLQDTDGPAERRFTTEDDGRPILADAVTWPLEA